MKKVNVTWDDIELLCDKLYKMLVTRNVIGADHTLYLYGVPTGGITPAIVLYNQLRARDYAADLVLDLDVLREISGNKDGNETILVVDDIADSGRTFAYLAKHHVPNAHFAALFMRHGCQFEPDYVSALHMGDDWLEFPWECKDADTKRDGTIV